jgi:hypothetical protein
VVAQERDQMTLVLEFDNPLDHPTAIGSSVDVIAQRDNAVRGARSNRFEESVEGRRTAVDVTDGDGARVHGRGDILTDSGISPSTHSMNIRRCILRLGATRQPADTATKTDDLLREVFAAPRKSELARPSAVWAIDRVGRP